MFLYYTIYWFGPAGVGRLTDPYPALTWLVLSVLLWTLILLILFKRWKLTQPDSEGYFKNLFGWALTAGLVSAYYVFSYQLQSNGTGWRFLTFWHPLLIIPLSGLFYAVIFNQALKLQEKLLGAISPDNQELDEKGIETLATVVSARQTGLYLNNQPQVLFELEFKDAKGATHRVNHKRIVSLLNLAMASQGTLPVKYLPDNPQKIRINVSSTRV